MAVSVVLAALLMAVLVVLTIYKKVQISARSVTHRLPEFVETPEIMKLFLVASAQQEILKKEETQNLVLEVLLGCMKVTVVALGPMESPGIHISKAVVLLVHTDWVRTELKIAMAVNCTQTV
jgi:hypothetical protein